MTKQEYDFFEDFILLADKASISEVSLEIGDLLVLTHSGEIKLKPDYEFYNYLKAKQKQGMRFKLIKGGL